MITHHGLTEKTRCRHCTSFSWQMSFCGNLVTWKTVQVAFGHGQDVGVSSCRVFGNFLPRTMNKLWCILENISSRWKPMEIHSKTLVLEEKVKFALHPDSHPPRENQVAKWVEKLRLYFTLYINDFDVLLVVLKKTHPFIISQILRKCASNGNNFKLHSLKTILLGQ